MSPVSQPWKTAEENSWWSATGKTILNVAFTNSLALSLPAGKMAVMTAPGVMEIVPVANVTAATRMAVVDAEWLDRADAQSDQITDAKVRLDGVKDICAGYRRDTLHPDAVAVLEQIDPLITAKSKGGVRL